VKDWIRNEAVLSGPSCPASNP